MVKTPVLHTIAVEALAAAHGTPERAFPALNATMLLHQVRRGWMDRNPWGLRLRILTALQGLHLAHPESWAALADLARDTLAEKRPAGAWSPDALHLAQTAAKELTRRASGQAPTPEG